MATLTLRNTKMKALTYTELDNNFSNLANGTIPINVGVGTIAAAATTDIGTVVNDVMTVTGAATITSFGNTCPLGFTKTLIMKASGIIVNPSANLIINIGYLHDTSTPPGGTVSYISDINDRLHVVCIGLNAGNNVYLVTIEAISGVAPGFPGISSANFGLSVNASANTISVFCDQITLSDWQSHIQGGGGLPQPSYGAIGNSRSLRLVNVGNQGINLLTCNVVNAPGLGGTDGSTITGTPATQVYFYLVSDGIGTNPTVGILASTQSFGPKAPYNTLYPYGCLIATNKYSFDFGVNALYPTNKTCDWVSFANNCNSNANLTLWSGQSASAGAAWSVATIVPAAGVSQIVTNATDPFLFQVSSSAGAGRVRLASDINQRLTPNFDYTGTGTPWTFTVYVPMGQAQLHVLSTDAGLAVRFLGANCPG